MSRKYHLCIEVIDTANTPSWHRSQGRRFVSRYKDAGVWSIAGARMWRTHKGASDAIDRLREEWAFMLRSQAKRLEIVVAPSRSECRI